MDAAAPFLQLPQDPAADPALKLQSQIAALTQQKQLEEEEKLKHFSQPPQPPVPQTGQTQGSFQSLFSPSQQGGQSAIPSDQLTNLLGSNPQTAGVSKGKERKDQFVGSAGPEMVPIQEIKAEFEAPPEVAKWVSKVPDPQTITLPKPVEDEYGEILLQATQLPKPNIVLPIDEEELEKAFHQKVADSIRWLAEWCKRVALIAPGRVFFKEKTPVTA